MPEDLVATQYLAFILKKQIDTRLSPEIDLSRAVLSEMLGVNIDPIDFRVVCTALVDQGILKPLTGDPPPFHLTDGGYDIADHFSRQVPEETKKRVVAITLEYEHLPAEQRPVYLKELMTTIPVESRVLVRRATPTDASRFTVNTILIEGALTGSESKGVRYRLENAERLSFPVKIETVKERLLRNLAVSAPHWAVGWVNEDQTISVVASINLQEVYSYYQATLVRVNDSSAESLSPIQKDNVIEDIMLQELQNLAKAHGWEKERFHRVFFNFSARERRTESGVSFTQYPTMRVELFTLSRLANGANEWHLALVADPGWHQYLTAFDWVKSGNSFDALLHSAKQFGDEDSFQLLPEREPCSLEETTNELRITSPNDMIRVRLRYPERTVAVPAERVALRKDFQDFAIGEFLPRPPTAITPPERLGGCRSWLSRVVPSSIELDGIRFRVIDPCPNLSMLTSHTGGEHTWKLNPPKLLFYPQRQRDITTTDPRALFRFGPFSGPRLVRLACCILPSEFQEAQAYSFVDQLREAYASANLGGLDTRSCSFLYYSGTSVEDAQGGLSSLQYPYLSREVIVVVGSGEQGGVYGRGKDLVAAISHRPSQFCQQSTARRIAKGSYATAKGLALQTYLKTLKSGEVPWQLGETVSRKKTLFIGIGYSKNPESKEEVTSHASLSLSEGAGVRWMPLGFPMRPRRYFDPAVADTFIRFLKSEGGKYPGLERIVVLRRGEVYPREVDGVTTKLRELKVDWDLDFVGVTDSNIRVFQNATPPENPDSGLLLLLEENRCLLSVSALPNEEVPEGSVRLLELTRVIGSTPMSEIGREVYDQTFLCWGSPSKPPKVPLPLDIAEKVAELSLRVTRNEVLEHFPL
ncbi:MAG: hypothetical protein JRN35_08355 [Nitrososphaerota archaeon]|nr:hypothetical protein [Nitrososphaerota archaeon]